LENDLLISAVDEFGAEAFRNIMEGSIFSLLGRQKNSNPLSCQKKIFKVMIKIAFLSRS